MTTLKFALLTPEKMRPVTYKEQPPFTTTTSILVIDSKQVIHLMYHRIKKYPDVW